MQIIVAPLCNGSQHTSTTLLGRYALREDEAHSDKNIGIFVYARERKEPAGRDHHPQDYAKRGRLMRAAEIRANRIYEANGG
jgi:hypothetical protein